MVGRNTWLTAKDHVAIEEDGIARRYDESAECRPRDLHWLLRWDNPAADSTRGRERGTEVALGAPGCVDELPDGAALVAEYFGTTHRPPTGPIDD